MIDIVFFIIIKDCSKVIPQPASIEMALGQDIELLMWRGCFTHYRSHTLSWRRNQAIKMPAYDCPRDGCEYCTPNVPDAVAGGIIPFYRLWYKALLKWEYPSPGKDTNIKKFLQSGLCTLLGDKKNWQCLKYTNMNGWTNRNHMGNNNGIHPAKFSSKWQGLKWW